MRLDLGTADNQIISRYPSVLICRYLSAVQRRPDQSASWHDRHSSSKEATMSDGLDTPAQQLAAAQGVVDALPDEAKQGLAATVVQGLPAEQQQAAAQGVLDTLSNDQRTQVAESVLGSPDRKTRQTLWYMIVTTLAAAVFVFGSMAFVLVYQKKAAEAPLALATTALGGIVGLIATSPGSRGG
jgi:hypothetical protein